MVMAGAAALFASIVVIVLANPPDAHVLLFHGGWRDGLFGVALVALVPLLITMQFGLGTAWARGSTSAPSEPWLLWLSGSAWLGLLGVLLAVVGVINPWVSGVVLALGVGYAVASGAAIDVACRLWRWLTLADVSADKPVFAAVRVGIVFALVLVGARAATGELNDTDVVQFYWGWLNEVRHLGGVRLSPDFPLIQDFTAGRGNGAYLFAAGFAPGLVSHAVSATYCVMFAVVLRTFVIKIAAEAPEAFKRLLLLSAELACLVVLWMLPGAVAFGKYHLQFSVWALGFLLACLHISSGDEGVARRWRFLVMPLAVAISIGLAQFEAFIALLTVMAIAVAQYPLQSARRLLPLFIVGCVGAGVSLLGNWLFLGIPDLNPFALFQRLIYEPRFAIWTSRLQQYYIDYVNGGVLSLNSGNGVSRLRELRSLASDLRDVAFPIALCVAGFVATAACASIPIGRRWVRYGSLLLLGTILGFGLYWTSLRIVLSDLAIAPAFNRVVLYALVAGGYLLAIYPLRRSASRSYLLGLLGYWLACAAFVLIFHSGSMDRLMRHADVVGVALALLAFSLLVSSFASLSHLRVETGIEVRPSVRIGIPILLAIGIAFSLRAAVSTAAVDPPRHLLASTLGLEGRGVGLTNPMAQFGRCDEIASSVPADARVLFLNAYTAMAYCNNSVLLPRAMVVTPHESDFARELATSAFADADVVEKTLRRLNINYFLYLKGDFEFWTSGLSAVFRPGEFERRFDLLAETPSFYVLTWRGGGKPMSAEIAATISEMRRFNIQQAGFMQGNEFIGQWRIMANLGADRPKYQLGAPLDFSSKGWSALYADHGWYAAEPHGTWTVGPYAVLTLPLAKPEAGPLRLTMDVMPLLLPQLPTRTVRVKANGIDVATWTFQQLGEDYHKRSIDLPAGVGLDPRGVVLTFDISNSISQYALRLNKDWRPLGFAVRSLTIDPATPN